MTDDGLTEFLDALRHRGVCLLLRSGKILFRAPAGTVTDEVKKTVAENRNALMARLRSAPVTCPHCRKSLDRKQRCWSCDYRACVDCGTDTGTALISRCVACGHRFNGNTGGYAE